MAGDVLLARKVVPRFARLRKSFPMSFQPIENYGVIGNMRSIALVGIHGSIDFLCYPDFDSPTVFAALLDDKKGGCFQIEPQLTNVRMRQLYLPDTNILADAISRGRRRCRTDGFYAHRRRWETAE